MVHTERVHVSRDPIKDLFLCGRRWDVRVIFFEPVCQGLRFGFIL